MNFIGWALLAAGVIVAILTYLNFLSDPNISFAWILMFFGIVILLFEAAFGRRRK